MDTSGVGVCECGSPFQKRSPSHRFCEDCSTKRDIERKRVWAADHPRDSNSVALRDAEKRSRATANGVNRNRGSAFSIAWGADAGDAAFEWHVRFAVPFTYAASKNHIYTTRGLGHVALRRESRATRDNIEQQTQQAVRGMNVVQAKVYLDLLVQKPDHRGDAVNMVDLVCDGVKRGLGVDDRWFCIRRLDWQIVKEMPHLVIGIAQTATEHHQVDRKSVV